jgi:folate-binding protein YgfZ
MFFLELSHYEFVRVSGEDRHKFLQGQVSCDMGKLTPGNSLRGALCNLKGRVIADFRALERGEDIWLQTQAGMAAKIVAVLQKYAVFSKVKLDVVSGEIRCFGLLSESSPIAFPAELSALLPTLPSSFPGSKGEVVSNDRLGIILPGVELNRIEIWDFAGSQPLHDALQQFEQLSTDDWLATEMRAGEIHVSEQMSEEFTPQLLNYDISGVINFKKGCYTGQEVVARMFYRAQAKKRLYLFASPEPIPANVSAIESADTSFPVLQVSNSRKAGSSESLLFAVVDSEVAEHGGGDDGENGGTFRIAGQDSSELRQIQLPYSKPV